MQLLALVWGVLAMIGFGVAFIPCLGALNWLNIPFAIAGVIVSLIALSRSLPGSRGTAIAALVLNLIAVVIGFMRLAAGHFIL
jgi:hypothetical protein